MCLICGENNGYFDDGSPCWGCNYSICECGCPTIWDTKCVNCGKLNKLSIVDRGIDYDNGKTS